MFRFTILIIWSLCVLPNFAQTKANLLNDHESLTTDLLPVLLPTNIMAKYGLEPNHNTYIEISLKASSKEIVLEMLQPVIWIEGTALTFIELPHYLSTKPEMWLEITSSSEPIASFMVYPARDAILRGDNTRSIRGTLSKMLAGHDVLYPHLAELADGLLQGDPDRVFIRGVSKKADPFISSPADTTQLSGSMITFHFDANGNTVEKYWLYLGSANGTWDYFDQSVEGVSKVTVNGLPTDGSTIYGALNAKISGSWIGASYYTFTAAIMDPVTEDTTVSVPSQYSTVQSALEAFANRQIASNATLTIQVANGTYTGYETIEVNHANGDRINIIGNTTNPSLCEIQFGNGNVGVKVRNGNKLGLIDGFTLTGYSQSANGISVFRNGTLTTGTNLVIKNCSTGVNVGSGGVVYADSVISKDNAWNGFVCDEGANLWANNATADNNGSAGFSISYGATARLSNATITNNSTGLQVIYNATATAVSVTYSGNSTNKSVTNNGVLKE